MKWIKAIAGVISGILSLIFLWGDALPYAIFFLGVQLLLLGGMDDSTNN